MTKAKKEDLEKIIGAYLDTHGLRENAETAPSNPTLVENLGIRRKNNPLWYYGATDAARKKAAREEEEIYQNQLIEGVTYDGLIDSYNNNELKVLLTSLPALKESQKYSELTKIHQIYRQALQGWKGDLALMKKDVGQFKDHVVSGLDNMADQADAFSNADRASLYARGTLYEAKRQLYKAVDKIKSPNMK